jgi:DNA-binding transcriptional MocR family regulator
VDRFRRAADLTQLLDGWASGPGRLHAKLAAALCDAVHTEDLRPGDLLPSERALADSLGVSRATIVSAYDRLRSAGLVESRRGSGTRVARLTGRVIPPVPRAGATPHEAPAASHGSGVPCHMIPPMLEADAEALDTWILDRGRRDGLRSAADVRPDPRGLPSLREAIAGHYTAVGLATTAAQVVVTTGASQAITLAAHSCFSRGSAVLVEMPGWPARLEMLHAAGARLAGVALDGQGINLARLADTARGHHRPELLYVTPAYQNPTGILMPAIRRRELAALAERLGLPVLEEHAYPVTASSGTAEIPPIASFASPGTEVLTVGSVSPTVWRGLRVGWIRASTGAVWRIARRKALSDGGSSLLDQAIAARLIPRLGDLAAAQRAASHRQLIRVEQLLREHLPTWRWRHPDGGNALWIELVPHTDARVFARAAHNHSVSVTSGRAADPSGAHDSHIVLSFSYSDEALIKITRDLADAWEEVHKRRPRRPGRLPSGSGPIGPFAVS